MKIYLIWVIAYIWCLDATAMAENDIFNVFSGEEIMLVCNHIANGFADGMIKHTESFSEILDMCNFFNHSINQGNLIGKGMELVLDLTPRGSHGVGVATSHSKITAHPRPKNLRVG